MISTCTSTTPDYYHKTGDTYSTLDIQFLDADGVAINISSVASVVFSMRRENYPTNKITDAACTVLDDGTESNRGKVRYTFTASQVDTAGRYKGEFKATFGTDEDTFPRGAAKYLIIEIQDSLS